MKKTFYCLAAFLFLFPLTTFAANKSASPSMDINNITVSLDGKNVNSGIVNVTPGQQLQMHVSFTYFGGEITNYPATQLKLIDETGGNNIQASANHFQKVTNTQAAEDVILSVSPTVKVGAVIPVKFTIVGPDINSVSSQTVTFIINEPATSTTDTSSSTESSSSN